MESKERIRIPFHFHPYGFEKKLHAVEKAGTNGKPKRYLKGITSGMRTDGHGERMTKNCIQRMQDQANSGEILLYEGQHGVTHTEDLGRLVESEITPSGEWITTYKLYDEEDGFEPGSLTLERADKLWRQVNGLPPYEKPLQKGFSIEGYIPDGGIIEMSDSGQRVIDNVDLDGVLVTPRPSYRSSVITSIYKALDEIIPEKKELFTKSIKGKFLEHIAAEEARNNFYSRRYKFEDILNESIEEIMLDSLNQREKLDVLFDEYKEMMIQLILSNAGIYRRSEDSPDVPEQGAIDVAKTQRLRVLKNIQDQLNGLLSVKQTKNSYHNTRRTEYGKSIKPGRKTDH